MFSNYLSSIDGVSFYAIVGLILFFPLFIVIAIKTLRTDKSLLSKWKNIPLEGEEEIKNTESENEKE